MKRSYCLFAYLLLALGLPALAQEGPLSTAEPKGITTDQIVQRFAAREKEFKQARESYTYRQDVTVQTLDGDTVDGEFRQVVDVTFDDKGRRVERVVFAPQSTLQRVQMTAQDYQDIEHLLPFVLTSDEIPEYNILYVGQQQEDELHCYVFDIAPKQIQKDKRYFQGRIWVDDRDFQIVKTHGKTVPDIRSGRKGHEQENLFPEFTTWRQQVDSQDGRGQLYWFPAFTKADDELHFSGGDVHIREIIKYTNYKRFGSKVKITYEGQELPKGQGEQQPSQPMPGQTGQSAPPQGQKPPRN